MEPQLDRNTPKPPAEAPIEVPGWLAQPFAFELDVLNIGVHLQGQILGALGPSQASISRMLGERSRTDVGSSRYRFAAKQPRLELVVDTGHLRRFTIHANRGHRITNVEWLRGDEAPRFPGEDPPPPPRREPLRCAAQNDLATFAEQTEDEDPAAGLWGSAGGFEEHGPSGSLRVAVRDEQGQPVEGAYARVWVNGLPRGGRVEADSKFSITHVPFGTHVVTAGAPGAGLVQGKATIAGSTTHLELRLERGACIRGRVVDTDDRPVAKARILWATQGGDWRNHVCTDAEGRFLLTNLPDEAGSLWACADSERARLPAAGILGVVPATAEVVLRIDRSACRGTVRIEPDLPRGVAAESLTARIWHVESGIGLHLRTTGSGAARALGGLPAGHYDVEFGAPAIGWLPAGRHYVDGRNLTDVGRIPVPEPGRVRFAAEEDDLPVPGERRFDLYRVRTDLNLAMDLEQSLDAESLLPAGDYAIAWRHRDRQLRFERFTVESGRAQAVRLQR